MPTSTRARLPCEARKEQQSIHHNMHTESILLISQFSNNQSNKMLDTKLASYASSRRWKGSCFEFHIFVNGYVIISRRYCFCRALSIIV